MAAKNGTLTMAQGFGQKITVSFYLSDVAGVPAKWSKDGKADANSPDSLYIDRVVGLDDLCIEGATGQTTSIIKRNDVPVAIILNANYLAAVNQRPGLGIVMQPGQKLTLFQAA